VQDTPLVDSAAALVLGPEPPSAEGLRLGRVTSDTSAAAALRREADEEGTLFVLGSWVSEAVPNGPDVHRAAPGSYCTGVWLELSENWREWQRTYRKVVLCDTDPRTGRSHLAVFTAAAGR
jgi:hypothetical protein